MRATNRKFRREIGSLEEVFRVIEAFIKTYNINDRDAYCIKLAAEEIFTNFVKHNEGGSEEIAVSIERFENQVHLVLVDFNVDDFDPPTDVEISVKAELGERKRGGLGLHIVRSMVDELSYDYDDENRSMRVSITKVLEN